MFFLIGEGQKTYITINYAINAYKKGNRDGFAIMWNYNNKENVYRTLNFNKFVDYIMNNKDQIDSAKYVFGHLRQSTTGSVEKEGIHLWKFGGEYYCGHNGVNDVVKVNNISDSYDFFEQVFTDNNNIINGLKRELEFRGGGAYFLISHNEKFLFGVNNFTKVNLHLINDKLLVVNSNDDIHEFNDDLEYETTRKIWKFGIKFREKATQKVNVEPMKIKKDLTRSLDRGIKVVEKKGKGYKSYTVTLKNKKGKGVINNNINTTPNVPQTVADMHFEESYFKGYDVEDFKNDEARWKL